MQPSIGKDDLRGVDQNRSIGKRTKVLNGWCTENVESNQMQPMEVTNYGLKE